DGHDVQPVPQVHHDPRGGVVGVQGADGLVGHAQAAHPQALQQGPRQRHLGLQAEAPGHAHLHLRGKRGMPGRGVTEYLPHQAWQRFDVHAIYLGDFGRRYQWECEVGRLADFGGQGFNPEKISYSRVFVGAAHRREINRRH
ncbi:unnamed protein product, partial [Ixodes pacificus]